MLTQQAYPAVKQIFLKKQFFWRKFGHSNSWRCLIGSIASLLMIRSKMPVEPCQLCTNQNVMGMMQSTFVCQICPTSGGRISTEDQWQPEPAMPLVMLIFSFVEGCYACFVPALPVTYKYFPANETTFSFVTLHTCSSSMFSTKFSASGSSVCEATPCK